MNICLYRNGAPAGSIDLPEAVFAACRTLDRWLSEQDSDCTVYGLGRASHRDARIAELEAAQKEGHAALTAQISENAELKRKLANHAARLGTALKTRSELLGKLRERDARIVQLEAEAGADKALLALADARLNREVLKTKGGA